MNWHIDKRGECRICGDTNLKRFLHFPNMPFTDEFVSQARLGQEFSADIDVYFCQTCASAQTLHDVTVTNYYRDYRYTVSNSAFARRFMERLAEETFRRFGFGAGDRVMEIGSGDGVQLSCFQQLGAKVLGFEPSLELTRTSRANGVDVVQCLFDADTVAQIPKAMVPAQVILLTYTFDHLPNPRDFLLAVRPILDRQRGILLIEVHDLEKIMDRYETCLFAHEHTIYLRHFSLKRLLERAGFRLLTTELLPDSQRRGNSLLIAAALSDATHPSDLSAENRGVNRLDNWASYELFASRVEQVYARMREYVRSRTARGQRIAGYGAGGRGVMTLAMAGLTTEDIAFLCDRNTSFHGLNTPTTHIPVVPAEHLLKDPVDEVIVFSYGYMMEIREQLSEYEKRGGRFVSLLDLLR